jgi:hypothetical protein
MSRQVGSRRVSQAEPLRITPIIRHWRRKIIVQKRSRKEQLYRWEKRKYIVTETMTPVSY